MHGIVCVFLPVYPQFGPHLVFRCIVLAWDYRRYVLRSMPVRRPDSEELAYTTHKIEANFSNFSAWHQRSKVYSSMWEKGLLDEAKTKDAGQSDIVLGELRG